MADVGSFSSTFSVVDDYSKKIKDFNDKLAKLQAPAKRLEAQINRFSKLTGFSAAKKQAQQLASSIGSVAISAVKTGAALGGISAATSIAGVVELARSFGDLGINLDNTAHGLDQTTESLQTLQNAARLTGVSASTLDSGMLSLSDTMQDAVAGRNVTAARAFQYLGINIRKSAYEAKSANDILPELADKIKSLEGSPNLQRNLARQFGVEGLLPLLRKGSQGVREAEAEVTRFTTFNAKGIAASERLFTGFTKLTEGAESFGYTIAEAVEPVLTPLLGTITDTVGSMTKWVKANEGLIQTKLKDWISGVKDWIAKIDWKQIGIDVAFLADHFQAITEIALGVWALKQVSGVMGLLGVATSPAGIAFMEMAGAIAALTGAGIGGTNQGTFRAGKNHVYTQDEQNQDKPRGQKTSWVDRQLQNLGIEGSGTVKGNPKDTMAYLMGKGMAGKDAAGLTAQFVAESGLNPFVYGDKNTAYGLGQWHEPRQKDYANLFGHTMQSVKDAATARAEQEQFALWELHNTEKNAANKLSGTSNAYGAGAALSKYYERPAAVDEAADNRGKLADQLYAQYGTGIGVDQIVQKHQVNGNINANINISGAPQGTKVQTASSGNAFASEPQINVGAMPLFQLP